MSRVTLSLMGKKPTYRKTYIREWRKHRGLTLEQVSSRLEGIDHDLGPSHLSMLERGERGYTQETLEALAEALQTDPASLLMRNPSDPEAIWSIWEQAKPGERQTIVDVARAIAKTGTK